MRFQLVRDLGRADRVVVKILGPLYYITKGRLQIKGDKRELFALAEKESSRTASF